MERNLIDWNLANWITVTLMAAVGIALIGTVSAFLRTRLPSASMGG